MAIESARAVDDCGENATVKDLFADRCFITARFNRLIAKRNAVRRKESAVSPENVRHGPFSGAQGNDHVLVITGIMTHRRLALETLERKGLPNAGHETWT